jgi:hypothetical protein
MWYPLQDNGGTIGLGATLATCHTKAEVYDGFTVSHGGTAVPLIIARPLGVSILLDNYKTSIKPIS